MKLYAKKKGSKKRTRTRTRTLLRSIEFSQKNKKSKKRKRTRTRTQTRTQTPSGPARTRTTPPPPPRSPTSAQQEIGHNEVLHIQNLLRNSQANLWSGFVDEVPNIVLARDSDIYESEVFEKMKRESVMTMHEYNILVRNMNSLGPKATSGQILKLFYQELTDESRDTIDDDDMGYYS